MYFYIIVIRGETILTKRDGRDIWKSLYQFPMMECGSHCRRRNLGELFQELMEELGSSAEEAPDRGYRFFPSCPNPSATSLPTGPSMHGSSMWKLTCPTAAACRLENNFPWTGLDDFPVPRLINRYMEVVKF